MRDNGERWMGVSGGMKKKEEKKGCGNQGGLGNF